MEKKIENEEPKFDIFKSTDFDFPKNNLKEEEDNLNSNLNNSLSDDMNNIDNDNIEDEKENDDKLTKELNEQCDLSIYVNHLELDEKSDEDLLNLTKEEIIEYKNYQILKMKTYIASLEKEKEDLIKNYSMTSDTLLDKIKDLEYQKTGFRPETPKIIFKKNNNSELNKNNFKNINNNEHNQNNKERCPNCGKEIKYEEYIEHSLQCLRKKYKCNICNILIDIEEKEKHINSFLSKKDMIEALNNKNFTFIKSSLEHGFRENEIILDEKNGDYLIHKLARLNKVNIINCVNDTDYNLQNKNKENALLISIENNNIQSAKELILKGANIKFRNKADLSPLMLCAKFNIWEIAEMLIRKGADVNEKNILGDTTLKIAQMNKNEDFALKLIKFYKPDIC